MGLPKKEQHTQAVGKSRGDLSTKIHAVADGLGNPLGLILTGGQASESGQSLALIDGFSTDYVGDKAYDSNEFVVAVKATGAEVVIPPKKNRKEARFYDKDIYKARNLVE